MNATAAACAQRLAFFEHGAGVVDGAGLERYRRYPASRPSAAMLSLAGDPAIRAGERRHGQEKPSPGCP